MSWLSRLQLRRPRADLDRERSFLHRISSRRAPGEGPDPALIRTLTRWGLGIGLLVFATLILPTRQAFRYSLSEGDVVTETIVSPITFSIYKSVEELNQQRTEARMSVPPVLELVPGGAERRAVMLDSLFERLAEIRSTIENDSAAVQAFQRTAPEVSEEALRYLLGADLAGRDLQRRQMLMAERASELREALNEVVAGYMTLGLVESLDELREIARGTVTLDEAGEESIQALDLLIDLDLVRSEVPGQLQQRMPEADDRLIKGGYEIAGVVLVPNLVLNGAVVGDVHASERVELAPQAKVTGNVFYRLIEMAMGAEVNGKLVHRADAASQTDVESRPEAADDSPLQLAK